MDILVDLGGLAIIATIIYMVVGGLRGGSFRPGPSADARAMLAHAQAQKESAIRQREDRLVAMKAAGPVVPLATGTGKLIQRNHVSGIPNGQTVYIDTDLAARGIAVIGPSGSGKTRAVLQPFVGHWLSDDRAGMFGFSEKANWGRILERIARCAGRTPERIHVVGPGHDPWPLLRGLSPDSVANFVRTAMGKSGTGDKFFISSAENLVRRTANVLYGTSQAGPITIARTADNGEIIETFSLDYDLFSVSKLARMDAETLEQLVVPEIRAQAAILGARGNTDATRRIETNLVELVKAATLKAEKQREGVIGTIDAVLAPFFSQHEFEEAFSGTGSFDLDILDRGDVVILDVDQAAYPGASTLAFLLAFQQMTHYMRRRVARQDGGVRLNPVLFLADEYAQVVDGQAHPAMWREAREALVCPLLAYQVHTDLQGAIGGMEGAQIADGMIRNFATTILFGTSDPASIALVAVGKSEVERASTSTQTGSHTGSTANPGSMMGGTQSQGENTSTTSSTSLQERAVVDEQLMDSLKNDIRRSVPVEQQVAEVIVRTVQGSRRVTDVCLVRAWDPPAA